jgi:CBS domain-containing protein
MAMDLAVEGTTPAETRAGTVANRDVPTCRLAEAVGDVADRLGGAPVCVVVEGGVVMGLLERDAFADRSRTAAEAMRRGPSTFRPSISKQELATYLDDHHMDHTVLTTLDGRLVGVVTRTDLGSN